MAKDSKKEKSARRANRLTKEEKIAQVQEQINNATMVFLNSGKVFAVDTSHDEVVGLLSLESNDSINSSVKLRSWRGQGEGKPDKLLQLTIMIREIEAVSA